MNADDNHWAMICEAYSLTGHVGHQETLRGATSGERKGLYSAQDSSRCTGSFASAKARCFTVRLHNAMELCPNKCPIAQE